MKGEQRKFVQAAGSAVSDRRGDSKVLTLGGGRDWAWKQAHERGGKRLTFLVNPRRGSEKKKHSLRKQITTLGLSAGKKKKRAHRFAAELQ